MPFERISPADPAAVQALTDLLNHARPVDDPDGWPALPALVAADLEFGWDLEPDEQYFYLPEVGSRPVGWFSVNMPRHDNRHLVWAAILVHPDHRRQGHGSAMIEELFRRAGEAGRSTLWLATGADDSGSQAFIERFGFRYAAHDARRRQRPADVDLDEVDRLYDKAAGAAGDYRIERLTPPLTDDVLSELVAVTAAINDAPMGDLTYEDEVFDVDRLRRVEVARERRAERHYRVVARHRETGEAAGHTLVTVPSQRPTHASQGDTAVARDHRGHRLGLLLKIEMMRWLAEAEPQIEVIETWNSADNHYMIDVNEAIGYRLSGVFNTFELTLPRR